MQPLDHQEWQSQLVQMRQHLATPHTSNSIAAPHDSLMSHSTPSSVWTQSNRPRTASPIKAAARRLQQKQAGAGRASAKAGRRKTTKVSPARPSTAHGRKKQMKSTGSPAQRAHVQRRRGHGSAARGAAGDRDAALSHTGSQPVLHATRPRRRRFQFADDITNETLREQLLHAKKRARAEAEEAKDLRIRLRRAEEEGARKDREIQQLLLFQSAGGGDGKGLIASLRSEKSLLARLKRRVRQVEAERDELEVELEEERASARHQRVGELHMMVRNLTAQNERLKNLIRMHQGATHAPREQSMMADEANGGADFDSIALMYEEQLERMRQSLREAEAQHSEAQQSNEQLQDANDGLERDLERARRAVEDKDSAIEELTLQVDAAKKRCSELELANSDVGAMEKQLYDAREDVKVWSARVDALSKELAEKERRWLEQASESDAAEASLKTKLVSSEKRQAKLKKELGDAREELQAKSAELMAAAARVEEAEVTASREQQNVTRLEALVEQLREENTAQSAKISEEQKKSAALQERADKLEAELKTTKGQAEELANRMDDADAAVSQAQYLAEDYKKQLDQAREDIKALELKFAREGSGKSAQQRALEAEVKKLKGELEEQKQASEQREAEAAKERGVLEEKHEEELRTLRAEIKAAQSSGEMSEEVERLRRQLEEDRRAYNQREVDLDHQLRVEATKERRALEAKHEEELRAVRIELEAARSSGGVAEEERKRLQATFDGENAAMQLRQVQLEEQVDDLSTELTQAKLQIAQLEEKLSKKKKKAKKAKRKSSMMRDELDKTMQELQQLRQKHGSSHDLTVPAGTAANDPTPRTAIRELNALQAAADEHDSEDSDEESLHSLKKRRSRPHRSHRRQSSELSKYSDDFESEAGTSATLSLSPQKTVASVPEQSKQAADTLDADEPLGIGSDYDDDFEDD